MLNQIACGIFYHADNHKLRRNASLNFIIEPAQTEIPNASQRATLKLTIKRNYVTQPDQQEILRAKVNLETSRIAWKELQRYFASGAAVAVSSKLDLVEVAYQMSVDNKTQIAEWLQQGMVGKVSDEQATAWYEADAEMWAVVISPWVLVQQADLMN